MARIKPKALLAQSKQKKGPTQIGVTTIVTFLLIIMLVVLALYSTYKYLYQTAPPQLQPEN